MESFCECSFKNLLPSIFPYQSSKRVSSNRKLVRYSRLLQRRRKSDAISRQVPTPQDIELLSQNDNIEDYQHAEEDMEQVEESVEQVEKHTSATAYQCNSKHRDNFNIYRLHAKRVQI